MSLTDKTHASGSSVYASRRPSSYPVARPTRPHHSARVNRAQTNLGTHSPPAVVEHNTKSGMPSTVSLTRIPPPPKHQRRTKNKFRLAAKPPAIAPWRSLSDTCRWEGTNNTACALHSTECCSTNPTIGVSRKQKPKILGRKVVHLGNTRARYDHAGTAACVGT